MCSPVFRSHERARPAFASVAPGAPQSDATSAANAAAIIEADERAAARAAMSAEVPQHIRDANYHAYLSASAARYDPEADPREFGYEDHDGNWHPMTPSTRQRYYQP